MQLAKQETPEMVTLPFYEVRKLRARLIMEEALETIEALGFHVYAHDAYEGEALTMGDKDIPGLLFEEVCLPDDPMNSLVAIADGCADLKVVTTGTLIACGIPDVKLQLLVDENNLGKFGPGHSIREDGKLIKPEGHKPPDIRRFLEEVMGAQNHSSL